jgi:RNA polymerase sigma-70 factor, ECF subfamily
MSKQMLSHPRTMLHSATAGVIVYRFPIKLASWPKQRNTGPAAVYWTRANTVEFYPFDAAYLARLRAHDPETEAHFASYFAPLINGKLRSQRIFDSAMHDIRQETLYRVLRAIYSGSIQNPQSLHSFVLGVCANVTLEYMRGQRRFPHDDAEEFPEIIDDRYPADGAARHAEMRDAIGWVLRQLTGKERRILQAVFLDEIDKDKICEEFGIDRDYLRVLVHRALASARKLFDKRAGS